MHLRTRYFCELGSKQPCLSGDLSSPSHQKFQPAQSVVFGDVDEIFELAGAWRRFERWMVQSGEKGMIANTIAPEDGLKNTVGSHLSKGFGCCRWSTSLFALNNHFCVWRFAAAGSFSE